jgi:hypothetical protein
MPSLHKVGCDEEKPPRSFDPADECNMAPIGRRAYGFIAWSPRAKGEGASDFTMAIETWKRGEGNLESRSQQ